MAQWSLMTWTHRVDRLPVGVRVGMIVVVLSLVVVVDAATGPDLVLTLSYALCVMAAAWSVSPRGAFVIVGLAAVSGFVVGAIERDHGWTVLVVNHALRVGSYSLFALFVGAVRKGFADLVDTTRVDAMTGVLSRAGFLDELASARRRAIDRETPLGLLYLDLDGLKIVNDRDGHDAGDRLIMRFVGGVQRHLRATDLFGRLGGDEFAIVLERIDPLVIDGVVARLLSDPDLPEVSCGVQVFSGGYPPIDQMVAGADQRMYADKQRRRADPRRARR